MTESPRSYHDKASDALDRIWDIVHTPSKATNHRSAERHFMADFDAIRQIIKDFRTLAPAQGSGGCDQIALDAAHQIECLPSAAEGQEARKTALIHLIVLDAIRCASADDLQLWIRHGRVGIGQSYRQEVERARKIETERSALTSPAREDQP